MEPYKNNNIRHLSFGTQEELSKHVDWLAMFFEDSPSSHVISTIDGRVVSCNGAFATLIGHPLEKMHDSVIMELVEPLNRGYVIEYFGMLRKAGTPMKLEEEFVRSDGKKLFLEVDVRLLCEREAPLFYSILINDLTEHMRAREDLEDLKNQAEIYLELLGHDVNNMNQAVMGYVELAMETIKHGTYDPTILSRVLEILHKESKLIDNVRKLQRIKSVSMNHELVDVGTVIRQVIDDHKYVPGRSISIDYKLQEACIVKANSLLYDAFANLIGNAIRHSTGHVNINVDLARIEEGGKPYCRATIEDDGPGIPDALKKVLFTRYTPGATRTSGTGMGLFLVKNLVESMHGDVRVEDRITGDSSKGAKFVVTLPLCIK